MAPYIGYVQKKDISPTTVVESAVPRFNFFPSLGAISREVYDCLSVVRMFPQDQYVVCEGAPVRVCMRTNKRMYIHANIYVSLVPLQVSQPFLL